MGAVRVLVAFFAVCAALGSGAAAKSADLLERVRTGEPVTIGYNNAAPWAYLSDSGEVTGYDPEVLRHLLAELGGGQIEGRLREFGALINGVRSKRIDVIATGMYVRPNRCRQVAFTQPVMQAPVALVVPAGNPRGLTTYTDFLDQPHAVLAVITGSVEAADAERFGLAEDQIASYSHFSDAVLAVQTGRADAAINVWLTARFAAKRWPEHYDLEVTDPIHEVQGETVAHHAAFAVHPEAQEFVAAINREMQDFMGSPEHRRIMERFSVRDANLPTKTTEELCSPE